MAYKSLFISFYFPVFCSSGLLESSSEGVWVVQLLVRPFVQRFRYHFSGNRPTNNLDRPEWWMTFVRKAIDQHQGLISVSSELISDGFLIYGMCLA